MSSGLHFEKEQVELILLRTKDIFPYWMWMSLYKWGVADSGRLAVKIRKLTVKFKQKKLYTIGSAQYTSACRQAFEFNVLTNGAVNTVLMRAPSLIPKVIQEVLQADTDEALAMGLKRLSVLWHTVSIWGFLDEWCFDSPSFIQDEFQALIKSWVLLEDAATVLMELSQEPIAPESLLVGMQVFKALATTERSERLKRHIPDKTADAFDIYWRNLLWAHKKYVYSPKVQVLRALLDEHFPCKSAKPASGVAASTESTRAAKNVEAVTKSMVESAAEVLETVQDTTWLRIESELTKGLVGWACTAAKVVPASSTLVSIQLATRFTDATVYLESNEAFLNAVLSTADVGAANNEGTSLTSLTDISWIRVDSKFVKTREGWKCLSMEAVPANSHPATVEMAKYFNKHAHFFREDSNILKAAVNPMMLGARSMMNPVFKRLSMELGNVPRETALRLLSSLLDETLNRK